jgi:transcriptional regulator with XRE-family HTH domain
VKNDTAKLLLERVKSLRLSLGLSQEAFAEKVGLGYKYFQTVEAGRRRDLRLSTLEKLASGCGLKLWELVNFDIEPPALVSERKKSGAKKGRVVS